ncbi:MAG: phosphatase PAP2 family protein [Paracoccaceae bacterium]
MSWRTILARPRTVVRNHFWAVLAVLAVILSAVVYPSDIESYRAEPYDGANNALVTTTEHYLRHVNTIAAFAVPILLRDVAGLQQLGAVTVFGILATHGPKRLLNDVVIGGTRLGERPHAPDSNHNMPSGHSALASTIIWFLGRRYSWWWLLLTVPVTLLTMYARVMLNAHTISAVVAGALIGLLVTALFVTKREK